MNRLISTIAALLLVLLVLYSTIFVVDQRSHAIVFALGASSCRNSICLVVSSETKVLKPVRFPPGRWRLETRP